MIDIENMLFDAVSKGMPSNVRCSTPYQKYEKTFPVLTLAVEDNAVYEKSIDSSGIENAAEIMVEVNIYSNRQSGKKQECKRLISIADSILSELNLTRILCRPTPNLEDSTIYRMTARYRAIVDKNNNIYRR